MSTNYGGIPESRRTAGGSRRFPELCITGYSCGDLFFQPNLRKAALNGLLRFTEATEGPARLPWWACPPS
ncbi:MAG: hypothetical protein ACLT38_04905 [Akkermansia sp.]